MALKKIGAATAAAALALSLTACAGGSGSTDLSNLKIGIKFDQPGLGLKSGDQYTGLDVDVATYIAGKLGTTPEKIQWTQAPSAQRETLIDSGQVDLVVATYSITDQRKQKVDFAGPYFIAGQDLLIRADDTSITGIDSLKGKKLCSVTGSTSAQQITDKVPGVNLQNFATYSECVAALAAKTIDALTTDDTILAGYAAQPEYKGKLRVVGKPFTKENYGVGLKKGNTELCNKVTDAIKSMIADGSWQQFIDKNLGPADYKPGPGNPPTPAACS
ncbi:glutamate ABC transporter substrate-binding protein [Micropruina sp.]|uniref:glutamate ABC transporter substrate-binding protein n=1 Tax=Micropruina sp. TaxID=2737536 RepID=UPI00262B19A3|nr:glutamate ABC transporter substrate-binding protein [Micropruina sp.]